MSQDATLPVTRGADVPDAGLPAPGDRDLLLDGAINSIIGLGPDGSILTFNRAAEEAFGLPRRIAAGHRLTAVLAPRSHEAFEALLARNDSERAAADDLYGLRRDGTEFPIEVVVTRFLAVEGVWSVVCIRDISRQESVESQLRHRAQLALLGADVGLALTRSGALVDALTACARAVIDRLPAATAVAIWTLDEDDNDRPQLAATAVSADFEAQTPGLGRDPEGLRDLIVAGRVMAASASDRIAMGPLTGGLLTGGGQTMAVHPLLSDDVPLGLLAVQARQSLSEVDLEGLQAVARKLALGIARQRSVDHVRQRAAELARSARALERSYRDLDQFAYIASHDLKAPLRGIANLAQWIEEDLGHDVPESVRGHLQLLQGRVARMDGLIDAILQYSRAGRIQMDEAPVDTQALVREVVDLLPHPPEARVIVASDLPEIVAPRLPLQQVFMNLIGNAVKYAGRPDVAVEITAEPVDGGVRFAVRDNGPGIAPAYHGRIWGVFQRLEARDKVEGTGIGLALVKKIVESAGGDVGLESQAGQGATFFFIWPERRHQEPRG
jgi:PAS domain S-box-containing protein